jgi:RNA polymerase sigma-70 factor (ECF subfamily)
MNSNPGRAEVREPEPVPGSAATSAIELNADESDRDAMRRLAAGHDPALDELMSRHGSRLFHYILRLLHNEDDAEDVAQETFVRVYQKRMGFDPSRKLSSWLYAIATNLVRDKLRWQRRHPEMSMDAEDSETGQALGDILPAQSGSPGEAVACEERAALVREAVSSLPQNWRIPLVLAEFEGRSHIEIGEILSCTPKAVEMRIARARRELREKLGHLLQEAA